MRNIKKTTLCFMLLVSLFINGINLYAQNTNDNKMEEEIVDDIEYVSIEEKQDDVDEVINVEDVENLDEEVPKVLEDETSTAEIEITEDSLRTREDEDYLIKDPILRSIINKRLRKDEDYNASEEELSYITNLDVKSSRTGINSGHYLKIESFEGFEYLTDLQYLTIQNTIMNEEAIKDIASAHSIKSLFIEYSFFTGVDDESITLSNVSINGAAPETINLSFNSYVSFEPLSALSNLGMIQLFRNGNLHVKNTEFGKSLSGFDFTGFEKLQNLTYFWLTGAKSLNDNSMAFLKSLEKINEITLYDVPLNTVEHLSDFDEIIFRSLQLSQTEVLDYTPLLDKKYFRGTNLNVLSTLGYYEEKETDGKLERFTSINTGIKVNEDLVDVSLSSSSNFRNSMEYLGYEIKDGIIHLNFKLKTLVDFRYLYFDEVYHGFYINLKLKFENHVKDNNIEFEMPISIGKRVNFNLYNNVVETKYFKPFDLIESYVPQRDGYTFEAWTKDKAGTVSFDFLDPTFDNQEIYAQWSAKDYLIKYNGNGATSGEMNDLQMTYDVSKELGKNNYSKTGYSFKGWSLDKNSTTPAYRDQEVVENLPFDSNGVAELFAVWKANTLKVTYKSGIFGIEDKTQILSYEKGVSLISPSSFIQEGYTLSGWKDDSGNIYQADADLSSKLNQGIETLDLTAIWSANTYTVTLNDTVGGNSSITQVLSFQNNKTKLEQSGFVREGYKLTGWKDAENAYALDEDFSELLKTDSGNKSLEAVWVANSYIIEFDAGSAAEGSMENITKTYGEDVELPSVKFTKKNHNFMGWAKEKDGEVVYSDVDIIKEDLTNVDNDKVVLYAVWESHFMDKMYNLEAQDAVLSFNEFRTAVESGVLEEKILEVTHAKGYKIDRDGTMFDIPVQVKNLDQVENIITPQEIDIVLALTVTDTTSRSLVSSDDINEVNARVKIVIEKDIVKDDKKQNPSQNSKNPNTGIKNTPLNLLLTLVFSVIVLSLIIRKKRYKNKELK